LNLPPNLVASKIAVWTTVIVCFTRLDLTRAKGKIWSLAEVHIVHLIEHNQVQSHYTQTRKKIKCSHIMNTKML
jgi:hypothetical protein